MSECRMVAMLERFAECHNGRKEMDYFEKFCFNSLVDLGEAYDKNQDIVHTAMLDDKKVSDEFHKREEFLNTLAENFRRVLGVKTKVSYPKCRKVYCFRAKSTKGKA